MADEPYPPETLLHEQSREKEQRITERADHWAQRIGICATASRRAPPTRTAPNPAQKQMCVTNAHAELRTSPEPKTRLKKSTTSVRSRRASSCSCDLASNSAEAPASSSCACCACCACHCERQCWRICCRSSVLQTRATISVTHCDRTAASVHASATRPR